MDDAAVVSGLVATELGLGLDERHRETALERECARGGESDDAAADDEDVRCAGHGAGSSHTRSDASDPTRPGRHAVTGKSIEPLAPAADPARFRDASHVEKWFKRNCNDTLDRPCTAAEKADLLAYLLTLRNGA